MSLFFGVVFIVLTNLFSVYTPRVVQIALDTSEEALKNIEENNFVSPKIVEKTSEILQSDLSQFFNFSNVDETINSIFNIAIFFALIYIVLFLIKGIFLFFTRQTIIVVSRKIEYDLKNDIFKHYQILSSAFYKNHSTGDLMTRISEDVNHVRMYLGPGIMYSINLLFLFILTITFMINVSLELTFYVLLPLPLMSYLIYKVSSIMNQRSQEVQKQQSKLSTLAQEAFSGIRVLKAYNREHSFANKFEQESEEYKRKSLNLVRVNAMFFPIIMLLIGLSTLLTVYVGGIKTINGEVSIGNIAEFIIYVNMLTWPFASLGWVTSLVQRAAASMSRINEFLNTKPDITWTSSDEKLETKGNIVFENVKFTYPETGITALQNFNLKINAGETIAILGKTGSGKSTVINLLCRLFDVDEGKILVDGKELNKIDLSQFRKNIGYVPQDVFLFSESIKNNIAFGMHDKNVSEKEIEKAAIKADVHNNILQFPNQYNTMVGERGITLSGGQKQRVSIARAIIKDPQILILDDSLSAVDTETEDRILSNIKDSIQQKTTILISHRVSTAKNADKIIFLENGAIAEMGNHDNLLAKEGLYYELYLKQLSEEKRA